jgi:hypothetical protein
MFEIIRQYEYTYISSVPHHETFFSYQTALVYHKFRGYITQHIFSQWITLVKTWTFYYDCTRELFFTFLAIILVL